MLENIHVELAHFESQVYVSLCTKKKSDLEKRLVLFLEWPPTRTQNSSEERRKRKRKAVAARPCKYMRTIKRLGPIIVQMQRLTLRKRCRFLVLFVITRVIKTTRSASAEHYRPPTTVTQRSLPLPTWQYLRQMPPESFSRIPDSQSRQWACPRACHLWCW